MYNQRKTRLGETGDCSRDLISQSTLYCNIVRHLGLVISGGRGGRREVAGDVRPGFCCCWLACWAASHTASHCQPVSQYSAHHGPGYRGQKYGYKQNYQTDKRPSQDISLLRHLLHRQFHRPAGVVVIHYPRGLHRGRSNLESAFSHNSEVRRGLLLHRILLGLPHLQ